MVYLYIALYPEAKPLIRRLQLKKQSGAFGFDVYENTDIRMVITGAGALAAASAVAASLAYYHAGKEDVLVNWGSCGAQKPVGTVWRCNKLIDRARGVACYPDMIYASPFPEACVVTEPCAWSGAAEEVKGRGNLAVPHETNSRGGQAMPHNADCLHDMEAAAVYYAAAYFLPPHQMLFFKVVTDQGDSALSRERLEQIMGQAGGSFAEYIEQLSVPFCRGEKNERQADEGELEEVCQEFHCSWNMRQAFLQCIKYWQLSGIDYQGRLCEMRASGELPCRDRREGKKRFEQLRSELLS